MRRIWSPLLVALLLFGFHTASAAPQSLPSAAPASARDLLLRAIGKHRLVLLGELHGTREIPALVGEVVDAYAARHRAVVLALEIPAQEQGRIDRYLASRGSCADRVALLAGRHWREPVHDGRDSEAMYTLIDQMRQLRARHLPVTVMAFDHGSADMDTRNRRMAQALRTRLTREPGATVLVLTGNVHAMTRRPPWDLFDKGKRIEPPMTAGRYLADLGPLSIDVEGASGAYWACVAGGCRVQRIEGRAPQREPLLEHHGSDSAWDAALVLPHFTPSPPAIEAMTAAVAPAVRAANP
jgi:hypothetical protein